MSPLFLKNPHFRRWIVAGLLLLLIWLVLVPVSWGLPSLLHAVLSVPVIFLLPGYLLSRLLFPRKGWSWPEQLPLAFGLSLGVGGLAWGGALLFGSSLLVLSYLLGATCTGLIAANVVAEHRREREERSAATSDEGASLWPYLLVLIPLLVWTVVAACYGALFMPETDNWYYLAIVRRIAQAQVLAPGDPFFAGVADPMRGGPWVALVALLVRLSGTSAVAVWQIAPAVLMPVAVLAHYLLGRTLFQDRLAAGLSCFFLLYGFGRFTWDSPMMVVSPAGVGFVLFLVALALAWRYLQEGKWPALALAILTAGTLAAVHLLVFAGYLFALGAFALLHLILRRQWGILRGVLLLTLVPALLAVPFVQGWTGGGVQTTNPIYADEWGLLSEFAGWHIVRPGALAGSGSSPWTWAFLLAPALLVLVKRRDWAIFLLATLLFVFATAFNPLFVEPLLQLHLIPPWGIWRWALQVFQFQFVLGGLGAIALRWLAGRMQQEWPARRALRGILLAAALLLGFLPSTVPLVKPLWAYATQAGERLEQRAAAFPFGWERTLAYLERDIPAGSVILADTNTSFFIPALTDQYVVAIPYGHSSPYVNDDEQRRQDAARTLDPATEMTEVRRILDRYGVDFVLLTSGPAPAGPASLSPETYARLVERFAADPAHFQEVLADSSAAQQTAIFAYRAGGGP
jgi:hypothetical protein